MFPSMFVACSSLLYDGLVCGWRFDCRAFGLTVLLLLPSYQPCQPPGNGRVRSGSWAPAQVRIVNTAMLNASG